MINDKKKIKARSRKPSRGGLAARLGKLDSLIEELRDALDPKEMKIVIWSPHTGKPEPNRDELPKGTVIVTMESPYANIKPDPETAQKLREEREAELTRAEAERQAEIESMVHYEPDPAPPQGGAHTHFDEQVTYEGYGVRWGKFPPIQHRYKNNNQNQDWRKLNRTGIF